MKYSDLLFDYLNVSTTESSSDFENITTDCNERFKLDFYEIVTDEESKIYNKPKGKYNLLSTPNILEVSNDEKVRCIQILSDMLKVMVGEIKSTDKVLIVGLGNRHISSDSLGAKVVGKVAITIENKLLPKVMAIAPSVMGLTGIETFDIIEGVVLKVQPTHLILIDSLCASSVSRLGRSIQVTNTGLCPGSGIGNRRKCIDNSLAKNVVSIGIPLLIFSSTFVSYAFEKYDLSYDKVLSIMQTHRKNAECRDIIKLCTALKKTLEDDQENMIVSIKDIEETVEILSDIVAAAINNVLGVKKV